MRYFSEVFWIGISGRHGNVPGKEHVQRSHHFCEGCSHVWQFTQNFLNSVQFFGVFSDGIKDRMQCGMSETRLFGILVQ